MYLSIVSPLESAALYYLCHIILSTKRNFVVWLFVNMNALLVEGLLLCP